MNDMIKLNELEANISAHPSACPDSRAALIAIAKAALAWSEERHHQPARHRGARTARGPGRGAP
jgi:hypothetical protein